MVFIKLAQEADIDQRYSLHNKKANIIIAVN